MTKYAQIVNGVVHGVFEYDPLPEFAPNIVMIELPADSPVVQNWLYTDGEFSEPPPEDPLEVDRRITKLAFLSRFTDEEAVTIDLASIGVTVAAATIRRYVSKINAADFIDLARPDLIEGVQALEVAGIITEGRAVEILESPIQDHEVPG